jgi:DNA polymerase-3 subunit beta
MQIQGRSLRVKFRCQRDALVDAIGTAVRAVTSRSVALPVLSGLLVRTTDGVVQLVGSDLELTVETSVPVEVVTEGAAVLPKLTGDIVRSLSGDTVTIEVREGEATITAERSEFRVPVLPVDDYPRLPVLDEEGVVVQGSILAEALRQVVPAASRDDARPILTGVLFEADPNGLRLVATDSYRLAVRDVAGAHVLEEDHRVLVPARALSELLRVLGTQDVTVILAEREAQFVAGATKVTTRLIEGDFPNYRQLLPSEYPNRLTLAKERFVEAVRRVRLVAQGRDNTPVKLLLNADGVELTASAQDVGRAFEALEAKYEGSEMTVAFNPEFLVDGLTAVEGSDVVLDTLDGLKPATIRAAEQTNFTYLLMPVRIP